MSHLSSVFNSVPVKIMDKSGFDMSHENLFTAKVGTLIPASVEEVMPGDVISVGAALSVQLPPLATDFKGRVDARMEAFFVPNRLLWAGWQDYICRAAGFGNSTAGNTNVSGGDNVGTPSYSVATYVPQVQLNGGSDGAGSLADYLGAKVALTGTGTKRVNALPFLAYQKIWDDWYRDSNNQQPFFYDGQISSNTAQISAASSPYNAGTGVFEQSGAVAFGLNGVNGRSLKDLAQRNYAKDYFTTLTTRPQAGADSRLSFDVTIEDGAGNGSFSIASLRAANALQKWLERNNIAGTRYYDSILAHYGVLPPDANVQRSILLGSMTTPVICNSIARTAGRTYGDINDTDAIETNGNGNPYDTIGAKYGDAKAFGKDSLIDNFEVKEHGFIVILFSLVPHAYYSTGTRRYLSRYYSGDYAFPEFANIGDQAVYKQELFSNGTNADKNVVGYNQRYSEYKYHDDEIHGLLKQGQSLQPFVLQRTFDASVAPTTSSFLQINTTDMDDVMVTETNISGFNAIVDAYFDAKYLRVLPEYSLPSL